MAKVQIETKVTQEGESYVARVSVVLIQTPDGNIENAYPHCSGQASTESGAIRALEEQVAQWALENGIEAEFVDLDSSV